MASSNHFQYKIIVYTYELILAYGILGYYFSKIESLFTLYGSRWAALLYLVLCLFILFKSVINHKARPLILFTIFCLISLFANISSFQLHNLLYVCAPLLSYVFGSYIGNKQTKSNEYLHIIFYISLVIICLTSIIIYIRDPIFVLSHRDYALAAAILLPFLFLIRNKYFQITMFVLLFIVILISLKRSLIIATITSLVIYYFVSIIINNRQSKRKKITLILSLVILCACVFVFLNYEQNTSELIIERFNTIESDEGSGRVEIYNSVLQEVLSSSDINILFGHGYDAVSSDLFSHPAHNDYLEILYDNGIIALFLWIIFIFKMIGNVIHSIKNNKIQESAIMLSTLFFWIIISATNCVYTNPAIQSVIFLFFGIENNPNFLKKK